MFGGNSSFKKPIAFCVGYSKDSNVESELEGLLARFRQSRYPETIPVAASYWLKTVWAAGHDLRWWKRLDHLLMQVLKRDSLNSLAREAIIDVQRWIEQTAIPTGQTGPVRHPSQNSIQTSIQRITDCEWLAFYAARLLNEWLPVEVAHLLVNEGEQFPPGEGIPALAIGRAVENLLIRARLSNETLELLLQPGLLSPRYIYPANAEALREVVLYLIGKTESRPQSVLPAEVLCIAPGSPLADDYRAAVAHAFLEQRAGREELHVPIGPTQASAILRSNEVHIGSIVVTMDGRWWESKSLQSGSFHSVVHLPMGLLRIDQSADHAKLAVPWPENRREWRGEIAFHETFQIFGREWRSSGWDQDAERAWLRLTYARTLTMAETAPAAIAEEHRLRPASVDIAWSALENALAASMYEKSLAPIERLYHSDLIPLGRAAFGLLDTMRHGRQRRESIEIQLRGVRYFASQVSSEYGPMPWRVLPEPIRASLLRSYGPELAGVFDGLPQMPSAVRRQNSPGVSRAA